MKLAVYNDHTILETSKTSEYVLDVGSRNFGFSNQMSKLGYIVYAIEPDADVPESSDKNIHLIRTALTGPKDANTQKTLFKWSTGEGNYVEDGNRLPPSSSVSQLTSCSSLPQISELTKVDFWDIIKLDCEGAEYDILLNWPGPIAGQITVEFHDFCGANPEGKKTYEKILRHLSQWYDVIQHEQTRRYAGNVNNYWDSLFVLKEEYRNEHI